MGWLEKSDIKLISTQVVVEVEVGDELGNYLHPKQKYGMVSTPSALFLVCGMFVLFHVRNNKPVLEY